MPPTATESDMQSSVARQVEVRCSTRRAVHATDCHDTPPTVTNSGTQFEWPLPVARRNNPRQAVCGEPTKRGHTVRIVLRVLGAAAATRTMPRRADS